MAAELQIDTEELQDLRTELNGLYLVGQEARSSFDGEGTHDLIDSAPSNWENPFELYAKAEERGKLVDAIAELSEREQLILSLYYREELTMKEVAEVVGIAISRVSQIHSRGPRQTAQNVDQNWCGDCPGKEERMNPLDARTAQKRSSKEPSVNPCNFRSAGRLSNESGRTLSALHELLARNLTNSLDVYFGTGLDVRLIDLEQLTMEDFRSRCASAGYMLPCLTHPSSATIFIEMDHVMMFTAIDLLLGGTGGDQGVARDLTEIDEEILEDVCAVIATQIERVWEPVGVGLTAQKCIKPNLAYRAFTPRRRRSTESASR